MDYLNFALLLSIFGSLLTSLVHSAPGVTLPTTENQSSDETTTEVTTTESEISSENGSNSTNECPTGWWFLEGHCYLFNRKERSFDKAQKSCNNMNATLFEPRDLRTNELVFEAARNASEKWNSKYIFFWIGIHDLNNEGNFSYASDPNGYAIQWTNWNDGEPNNFGDGDGEDCVYGHDHGKWNDMNCTALSEFICEKPVNGSDKVSTDSSSKDHLKVDEGRANLMADIKACNGGESCLKPVDGNNSVKMETISQNDSNSSDQPNLASPTTTTQNVNSNPDLNVEITTTATTFVTKSTTSASKETTEPAVQKNSPRASPIVDSSSKSTRKFDGWSFFGGIIVTIGTAAIAFVGVKYYQARSIKSQNYNLM